MKYCVISFYADGRLESITFFDILDTANSYFKELKDNFFEVQFYVLVDKNMKGFE